MLHWLLPALAKHLEPDGSGQALVTLATRWLDQGVSETGGSNAGPDVSWLIHDGGGNPASRPPWCAYFISSLCRQAERVGFRLTYSMTGRAVAHWQKAPPESRIMRDEVWTEDPRGLVCVRTRMSRDASDSERARLGALTQGHVGLVVSIDASTRRIGLIAGNSSGSGHQRIPGGGAIARESITEGDAGWLRVVGFVRVASP